MHEIVLAEAKPAFEWINGRALQKVTPQRKHALAQTAFAAALLDWARQTGAGRVGTEWEFRIGPPGEDRRPLVPDVAYLSYSRVPYERATEADIPRVAPDVVVEILSPHDAAADVEEKVRVYLSAGTGALFLVDTAARTVCVRELDHPPTLIADNADIRHEALPGFSLAARLLFEEPKPLAKSP